MGRRYATYTAKPGFGGGGRGVSAPDFVEVVEGISSFALNLPAFKSASIHPLTIFAANTIVTPWIAEEISRILAAGKGNHSGSGRFFNAKVHSGSERA